MSDSEHGSGDVLARLEAMAPELSEAIAELEQERSAIDEKLRRLRLLHRSLTGESSPTQAKATKSKSSGKKAKPGEATLRRVAEAAKRFDEPFSARELRESMEPPMHESNAHLAIKYLRNIEFLGAAGKKQAPGAPRPSETYRVMDADALDRALSESRPSLAAVA